MCQTANKHTHTNTPTHTQHTHAQHSRAHHSSAVKYGIMAIPRPLSFVVEWFGNDWDTVFPRCLMCRWAPRHLCTSRVCIPGCSYFFGHLVMWELTVAAWLSRRIGSPLLSLTEEKTDEGEKRAWEEREGSSSLKGENVKPIGGLNSSTMMYTVLFFSVSFWFFPPCHLTFPVPGYPPTTGRRGGREVRRRGGDRKKSERLWKESGKRGMQRWKRVVVISSFGGEQIIKHFLKPISALMYICEYVCVCNGNCKLFLLLSSKHTEGLSRMFNTWALLAEPKYRYYFPKLFFFPLMTWQHKFDMILCSRTFILAMHASKASM